MQFSAGDIVRSTAGRDRDRLYVVVAVKANRIMVADGYRRTILAPKPKNPAHLRLVSDAGAVETDSEIRRYLKAAGVPEDSKRGELK